MFILNTFEKGLGLRFGLVLPKVKEIQSLINQSPGIADEKLYPQKFPNNCIQ